MRLYVKISQAMATDVFILEILVFLHLTPFNPQVMKRLPEGN